MRSITLRNFRCFGDEAQTARLAPLTLLVGENSSGKTSLMAMVRAMWDVAYGEQVPDFKEDPYDLGSFEEIAHHRGARGSRATTFESCFEVERPRRRGNGGVSGPLRFTAEFAEQWSAPVPVRRRVEVSANRDADDEPAFWIEHQTRNDQPESFDIGTPDGAWRFAGSPQLLLPVQPAPQEPLVPIDVLSMRLRFELRDGRSGRWDIQPIGDSPEIDEETVARLESELSLLRRVGRTARSAGQQRPFASAPVRSQPRRTYDPVRISVDSFGDAVPTYLAQMERRTPEKWTALKAHLEQFGSSADLFNELRIRRHGSSDSAPFQIQVRKFGDGRKGPYRNLVDVGYGISQVLPVITELLRPDGPQTALLQQPEVHLHPVAQASLGSLLCDLAEPKRGRYRKQIVVETHSDFIIDRVRMAVRDKRGGLSPEDVSIVFFERSGLDVRLHSISVDSLGNIQHAPAGYRQFFLDELQRSFGT